MILFLRPVISNGTWATAKGDYSKLSKTERKALGKIFGPVNNTETRTYGRRHGADV